jgi:serine/threonine protein kinase
MEYFKSRGLKEVIEVEAPTQPARVSIIAQQIAGALNAAHCLGVVHRDVKPANSEGCVGMQYSR